MIGARRDTRTVDDLRVVGPRHTLRYAAPGDAEALLALAADDAVTRFFSWGPYRSIAEPLAYIESLAAKRESGRLLEFVIVERGDDRPIGVTGLTEFSLRDRRAVVGSWLGREHWGTGANAAAKALVLALGFKLIGLNRVSAYSHVDNLRSEAALAKVGFVREGVLHAWHRHRGEPQDVAIHCLLRDRYLEGPLAAQAIEFAGELPHAFSVSPASAIN